MLILIVGLVLFLGLHSLQIVRPAHDGAVAAMGDTPYRLTYSLASLAGLVLVAQGYSAWRWEGSAPILYVPPAWASHVTLLLMAFAFVALAAAYAPGHIKRTLKHPMLVAVKVWAVAHLLANGNAAAVLLFGAFLAWAVADRISVKRRERAGLIAPADFEPRWQADLAAVAIGLTVYGLFVWKLHLWLIGVSPVAMTPAA
ncbi:NnrU family protein [Acuticoccus sp.]|uniref:NnrU family protein n=1 Tax=Acuticoccus sp. TaxID=1904378 RepID=UPI003B5218EC